MPEATDLFLPEEITFGSMAYYSSVDSISVSTQLLPYVRVLQRAWDSFGLTGVLCVDNIPTVYVKDCLDEPSDAELIDLHRRYWSQGIAQTLVVATGNTVRILSGLATPQSPDSDFSDSTALVQTMERLEFIQNRTAFCETVANGTWYTRHQTFYDLEKTVDAYLLDNLVALRNVLASGQNPLPPNIAHAFIGRMLFVCYLIDRDIVGLPVSTSGLTLGEALDRVDDPLSFLYDLFKKLKGDFNGSMFDQDLESEQALVDIEHLNLLADFLNGRKVGAQELTLNFWAYDFEMIPVEMISSIYEEFLAHENPEGKRDNGAFYTPRFLAEMTLDVAIENSSDWHQHRYLDPCCGSGIFLVAMFNRLATHWILDNPGSDHEPIYYKRKAEALLGILENQICGVDLNITACRLACFSLYVALLDSMSPSDIQTFVIEHGNKLPCLLETPESDTPEHSIPIIFHDDFLKPAVFVEENIDCIIGNPPWQGRGSKQLAIHVVNQAQNVLKKGGEGTLLLPSKVFLNSQTNDFQREWLKKVQIKRVVQLADFSFILFEHAKCPCMIVRYSNQLIDGSAAPFPYDTPKFNSSMRRRGQVTIQPSDRNCLSQINMLAAAANDGAPVLWKRWLWGTSRDQRVLEYLGTFPKLSNITGAPKADKRWKKGQGFQPDTSGKSTTPQKPWWNESDLYMSARSPALKSSHILHGTDYEKIGLRFELLHRSRDRRLYESPLVLVNQGFGNAVFSNQSVLFQDSLQSISGPKEDADLLMFLTVVLRSRFAKYAMFHTAANWGTERDKVHLDELLTLPFPLPEDAPASDAHDIVAQVAKRLRAEKDVQTKLKTQCWNKHNDVFGVVNEKTAEKEWRKLRRAHTDALQTELDQLVYRYYGLLEPEIALIEDTITISIPSSTPPNPNKFDIPTLQLISENNVPGYDLGLTVYADCLTETLTGWAEERGSTLTVSAMGMDATDHGLAMVVLSLGESKQSYETLSVCDDLIESMKKGCEACIHDSQTLRSERDLLWFDGDCIRIIRPNTLAHWTRTAALNDASRIFGEIVAMKRHARG